MRENNISWTDSIFSDVAKTVRYCKADVLSFTTLFSLLCDDLKDMKAGHKQLFFACSVMIIEGKSSVENV